MNYKVLSYLMNEKCTLIHLERDGQSEWMHISATNKKSKGLKLISNRDELINENHMHILVFEDSELRYDKLYGRYVNDDDQFILMNRSDEILPNDIKELLESFLN
jgi:hypothetical protein